MDAEKEAHLCIGRRDVGAAVVAILKPDGQHSRQGLIDIAVAMFHSTPIIAEQFW